MVNSGSFDSDRQGDRNAKAGFTQPHNAPDSTQSSSPVTASVATSCKTDFSRTADSDLPTAAHEPTPTKTEFNSDIMPGEKFAKISEDGEKTSLCCSVPLEKVQGVLTPFYPPPAKPDDDGTRSKQPARKLLCLYCDRSFVSANLRQKHVERVHSVRQNRRVSSRRQNQLTATPCVYCDKLNGTENTLKDLFQHLINAHSSKYFGCLPCADRFLTSSHLADHNASVHQSAPVKKSPEKSPEEKQVVVEILPLDIAAKLDSGEIPVKVTRSKVRPKSEAEDKSNAIINKKKSTKLKELRAKKLSVKSSRMALKRRESKRLQAIAKITDTQKKKRQKPTDRKQTGANKTEPTNSTKSTEKSKSNSTSINPYPEFDHFYRVKKITDHSIDNLKISSLTFDDVFDKAFFNRIKCNIEENLLHHIDGKLFKNEESESRISNFEKISNTPQEVQSSNSESYGCELSLNAVTPVASLSLTSQFGEDFESQIEYGSKPSKKKTQTRKDEVHYKYFTRRKYQASILEHKENRDLSKLDMWTQLVIKRRQQKMLDDKKSAKEILEYTACDEYKNKIRREELNSILDRRGPFEDLKEEASKKAALDKLNLASTDNISQESFTEVREVLNEILNRVFINTEELCLEIETIQEHQVINRKLDVREIPCYLNLRRSSSLTSDGEIDKSDRIALICSSQETENFELPTNQVRGKNELVELTGEWARCRMYICAACGAKLPNMKFLLEHKSLYHQNVWVQHYEFVGNQSELYRHLSIPALGKVGAVEESVQCKVWRRSDARVCTKCGKQCNALAELHRHILECGGDWTWMLARKKCKYRPYGAKSRRKRRGLIHRVHHKRKTEPTEKKTYKKRFEGPRQRPSDADTIERMLANLPAKRSTRKLISLYDGIYRARKKTQININQKKVKCGKVIYKTSSRKDTTEKTVNATTQVTKSQKNTLSTNKRSLRSLNKVLASRILDTNAKLSVKRKLKVLNDKRKTRQTLQEQEKSKGSNEDLGEKALVNAPAKLKVKSVKKEDKDTAPPQPEAATKRSSPRCSPQNVKNKMTVKKLLTGNISIKSFFPVKKKKHRKDVAEAQNVEETVSETENKDVKTRSKRKSKEICEPEEEEKGEIVNTKTEPKKTKSEKLGSIVRTLSFHRKNTKSLSQNNITVGAKNEVNREKTLTNKKKDTNEEKLKKRKLKSSLRSVINKVKKIKIDNAPNSPSKPEEPKKTRSPFLEESIKEGSESLAQAEKIVIPSVLEASENTADLSTPVPIVMTFNEANENPPIPETIFKLESNNEKNLQAKCELVFDNQPNEDEIEDESNTKLTVEKEEVIHEEKAADKTQPITIETSVKSKVVPMISPNMKGKIRKPTRGLNDCIAMLTSKLHQKSVEEAITKPNSVFNVLTPSTFIRPPVEIGPPKTECILRIPTFKTQSVYPEMEETALDLSTKSLSSDKSREMNNTNTIFNNSLGSVTTVSIEKVQLPKIYNSVDRTIEDVVENKTQKYFPLLLQSNWNSVDETIQKVIDNTHPLSYLTLRNAQMPVRNTIDEIIEFVVTHTAPNHILSDVKPDDSAALSESTKTPSRKIGAVRRPSHKISALKTVRIDGSTEGVIPKITLPSISGEILASIATATIEKAIIEKFNLVNATSDPIKKPASRKKKERKEKKVAEPPHNPNGTENNFETTSSTIINQLLEDIIRTTKCDKENTACDNSSPDVVETAESDLNIAFIGASETGNQTKSKKGGRKLGQIRNRSRSKKVIGNVNKNQETFLLETNVDALSDVKEIKASMLLPKAIVVKEGILTKNEEIKQMVNEDEPDLLENKIMTPQRIAFPSDSEDDLPLAALVKPEDECTKDQVADEASKINTELACNIASQDAVAVEENILPNNLVAESTTKKMDQKKPSKEKRTNGKFENSVTTTDEMLPLVANIPSKTLTVEEELLAIFGNANQEETDDRRKQAGSPKTMLNQTPNLITVPGNEVNELNRTLDKEEETEESKRNPNKKKQRRKSKSVRRKSRASLPKLPPENESIGREKSDSSTDSDVPLTEVLKGGAAQIIPTESAEDNSFSSNQNMTSEEKSDEVGSNLEASPNTPSSGLDLGIKTTKRRSRSVKAKWSQNSKAASENLPPLEMDYAQNNLLGQNNTSTNELVESDTNITPIFMLTEVDSNEPVSPPVKSNDSQSDLDSDTPLAVIVSVKNTEDVLQLQNLNADVPIATADVESDSDTPLTKFISNKNSVNKDCVENPSRKKTKATLPLAKAAEPDPINQSTNKSEVLKLNTNANKDDQSKNNTASDLKLNSDSKNKRGICQSFLQPNISKKSIKRRSRSLKTKDDESLLTNLAEPNLSEDTIGNNVSCMKTVTRPQAAKDRVKPSKKKESDSVFSEESNVSSFSDSSCADIGEEVKSDSSQFESHFLQPKTRGGRASRSRSMSVKSNTSTDDISADSLLNDSSLISNDQFKEGLLETSSPFVIPVDDDKKKARSKRKPTTLPEENLTEATSHSTSTLSVADSDTKTSEFQPKSQTKAKKCTKKPKSAKNKPLRNGMNSSKAPNSPKEIDNQIDQHVAVEAKPFKLKESAIANKVDQDYHWQGADTNLNQTNMKPKNKGSRSVKKTPVATPTDKVTLACNEDEPTKSLGLLPRPKKITKKRSKSLKNDSAGKIQEILGHTINALLIKVNDDPIFNSKAKSNKKGRSRSLTNMSEEQNILPDACKPSVLEVKDTVNKEDTKVGVKPMLKRRQSLRNSQKEKCKENKSLMASNNIDQEAVLNTDLTQNIRFENINDVLKEPNICSVELLSNEIDKDVDEKKVGDLAKSPNHVQEPPIKIIINKQKTRRKSKSFKKADLKGQNDLFEDFALVIKKAKRIAPMITYTPADTFARDIYPRYIKQPVEQLPSLPLPPLFMPLSPPIITPKAVPEETEDITDLDASVEEMDMELDEIPIVSNIIERDSTSFVATPTVNLIDEEICAPVVTPILQNDNQSLDSNEEEKSNIDTLKDCSFGFDNGIIIATSKMTDSVKDASHFQQFSGSTMCKGDPSPENVFQCPKEDLPIVATEEYLYETNNHSKKTVRETKASKKSKSKSRTKSHLGESFEKFHDSKPGKLSETSEEIVVVSSNNYIASENIFSDKQKETNILDSVSVNKPSDILVVESITATNIAEEVAMDLLTSDSFNCTKNIKSGLNDSKSKKSKKKKSKGRSSENIPRRKTSNFNSTPEILTEESTLNKEKDIDSIYTFTELEDLEIEKPIEIPLRMARKQPKTLSEPENQIVREVNLTEANVIDISVLDDEKNKDSSFTLEASKPIGRRKSTRSGRDLTPVVKENSTGEIKENTNELLENGRRKSVRNAKVKAMEHIHDDALAELTESERNRGINRDNIISSEDITPAVEELPKKKSTRRQSRALVQEISESIVNAKEITDIQPLIDDVEVLTNIEVGLEAEEILKSQEDINVANELDKKVCNGENTTIPKNTERPFATTLENLETISDEDDKLVLQEKTKEVPKMSKKKNGKKQSKARKLNKPLIDNTPNDAEKSTAIGDLETELLNVEDEVASSGDNTVSLDSVKTKANKKTKKSPKPPFLIPELSKCAEIISDTLDVDGLKVLEKSIQNELEQGKSSVGDCIPDSDELSNKLFNKKTEQTERNEKLLDTFDSSSEIAQKCAELIDFADNIAGLEELENSIERELNLELEATEKTKQSKNKEEDKPENKVNEEEEYYQELRRSRRGSRKVTSYNENDLIDPLLDEIDGKRKSRKKERGDDTPDGKITKKSKESEKKLNSDELFDLLKASSTEKTSEKTYIPKTSNTFISNLEEESSKSFNTENFDNVFENILEKSFLLQSTLKNKRKEENNIDKIYEFTESPENTEHVKDNLLSLETSRKATKKPSKRNKSPLKAQNDENSDSIINISSSDNVLSVSTTSDLSVDSKIKQFRDKTETDKSSYCEICNKSFMRTESLTKHKRTLTHIQKLSEIEAKEAAEKSKLEQTQSDSLLKENSDTSNTKCDISRTQINISDILQDSNKPNGHQSPVVHSSFANNHSLKLADIINDVLNKPVLEGNEKHNNFSDIIMQNSTEAQPEYRRYKSLGERKSFDSEPVEPQPIISEPYMSKTTILEKQISLLENIIEHQSGVNYIDDISMSSNNTRQSSLELSLKQDDSSNIPYNTASSSIKPTSNEDSFLKPSQYEEISEDSVNLRNYEDQRLRKALNRDEELFLECCSLLKSGSEVSSYSTKKLHGKILSNMGLKQCDEPEWLERKSLVQKPLYDIANEYCDDNSRIPTPLGDSYDDDASNSNTISSNWNMNKKVSVFEDKQEIGNKNFSFEEVLNRGEQNKKVDKGSSKFGDILTQAERHVPIDEIKREPFTIDAYDKELERKQDDLSDGSTSDSKKIITKGARKVFEGLKVSIPTEELNLEEVLNCSPRQKKLELHIASETIRLSNKPMTAPVKPLRTARKSKPVKNKSQIGSNLLFKMNKKKVSSPTSTKKKDDRDKTHDIYDFEETQDNTDMFTKPDFKAFRNMKSNEALPEPESDTESHDYLDSFSLETPSMTSSVSSSSSKKPKTQENITKKKCMIMGRIFKNQAKSKIEDIDEEMRNIPEMDNSEIVENYVADCKKVIKDEDVIKPKLSETEINLLFDKLLENKFEGKDTVPTEMKPTSKSKSEIKRVDSKKKMKLKNRKRARTNSESTDDEFNINKVTKKRAYRKNGKAEDNCINLEQELKECIGVASRKSQRKCTSGKQNVLVEYWSSDESQFEALLESQRIEVKVPCKEVNGNKEPQQTELVSEALRTPVVENLPEVPKLPIEASEKPHKPKNADKKPQQKKKPSNEKPKLSDAVLSNRRKRAAANPLYHWSSSSEDESHDLIEVKPIRDEQEDEEDRPIQHGWIVGDSPKKLVTMLAQAKGKKTDIDCVKEQGKKRTNAVS